MKIRPDQVDAVQREAEAKAKPRPASQDFSEVLAREVGGSEAAAEEVGTAHAAPVQSVNPLLDVAQAEAATPTPTEQEVMEHIDSVLEKWEKYAHTLADQDAEPGLRSAYTVLESISGDVAGLRNVTRQIGEGGLQSLVQELEILTVTEQFKFNRGDYS
ncbi:MAG: hypothetical protein D6E12_05980 [Desulfovibrio sp.]|nr:MAG: hypothetical protein D6E12_05980 [Desulfovibrio sp.]